MLTGHRLREVLLYEPTTGDFCWRSTLSSAAPSGHLAGSRDRNGYVRISIDGRRYLAHRLAWLYTWDVWPTGQIDHINGTRSDNRFANLRDVTAGANQQNRHGPQGANRFPWVSWKRREARWRAAFNVDGRTITVGHFGSDREAFDAAVARRVSMGLPVPSIGADGAPAVPTPTPEPAKAAA